MESGPYLYSRPAARRLFPGHSVEASAMLLVLLNGVELCKFLCHPLSDPGFPMPRLQKTRSGVSSYPPLHSRATQAALLR